MGIGQVASAALALAITAAWGYPGHGDAPGRIYLRDTPSLAQSNVSAIPTPTEGPLATSDAIPGSCSGTVTRKPLGMVITTTITVTETYTVDSTESLPAPSFVTPLTPCATVTATCAGPCIALLNVNTETLAITKKTAVHPPLPTYIPPPYGEPDEDEDEEDDDQDEDADQDDYQTEGDKQDQDDEDHGQDEDADQDDYQTEGVKQDQDDTDQDEDDKDQYQEDRPRPKPGNQPKEQHQNDDKHHDNGSTTKKPAGHPESFPTDHTTPPQRNPLPPHPPATVTVTFGNVPVTLIGQTQAIIGSHTIALPTEAPAKPTATQDGISSQDATTTITVSGQTFTIAPESIAIESMTLILSPTRPSEASAITGSDTTGSRDRDQISSAVQPTSGAGEDEGDGSGTAGTGDSAAGGRDAENSEGVSMFLQSPVSRVWVVTGTVMALGVGVVGLL